MSLTRVRIWRNRRARLTAAVLPLLLALSSCGSDPVDPGPDPEGLRVLFIGNSLTYTYDVPGILRWILTTAEVPVGRIEAVAYANFGLQDHWVTGGSRTRIAEGNFDVVVLQQGPSATEGRPSLLEYSQLFAEEIVAAGGRPALYMVWPSAARDFDFDGVSDSYQTAAELVDGLLFPAGEAWRAAWRVAPGLPLYGPDGFHPSEMGSYLAALVMAEQLGEVDASSLPLVIPTAFGGVDLDAQTATILQNAAKEANAEFARTP